MANEDDTDTGDDAGIDDPNNEINRMVTIQLKHSQRLLRVSQHC